MDPSGLFAAAFDSIRILTLEVIDVPTEAIIRHQLHAAEMKELESGGHVVHEISQTAFLVAGLHLEDLQ